VTIYIIGFTRKSAKEFLETLRGSGLANNDTDFASRTRQATNTTMSLSLTWHSEHSVTLS